MRSVIKAWITVSDIPQSATLFGVLDADRRGTLPVPSSDGHWEDVKTATELGFQLTEVARTQIAKQGYYLFGPGTNDSAPTDN